MTAAKCFSCIPKSARRWVRNYLLCQYALKVTPTATGFALTQTDTTGATIAASWDALPTGVTSSQVWTSTDNVNFSLATTIAAPGNSTTLTPPGAANVLYAKVLWCTASGCGSFSSTDNMPGCVPDYAARVITNGGAAVSVATLAALRTFAQSLNTNGLFSSMVSVLTYAPDNLIAAITPFIKTAGNDPWTNNGGNFVAGDLTINGLKGNASTKVLDSGLVSTAIWQNTANNIIAGTSGGISLYTFDVGTVASGTDIGASNNAASGEVQLCAIFQPTSNNNCIWDFANNSTARVSSLNTGFTGFTSGSRTSGSRSDLYHASSTVAFANLGNTVINAIGNVMPIQSFAAHGFKSSAGVLTSNSDRRISFAAFHLGLTSAQTQALYNAVQALRVGFGGGFV